MMKKIKGITAKVALFALMVAVMVTSGTAEAALDITAIGTALTANLTDFQSVGSLIVSFVLGVAVFKGVISWLRTTGR
jgi:hypothetical protein